MDVNAELEQLPPERNLNENEDGGSGGEVRLQRTMGLWTGVSIIVGGIIGNYIYIMIIMSCVVLRTHKILGPIHAKKPVKKLSSRQIFDESNPSIRWSRHTIESLSWDKNPFVQAGFFLVYGCKN